MGKDRFFHGNTGLFKVELWSVLCRLIMPDALIAAYFVENGIDDLEQLAGIPNNLFLSDTLLTKILTRGRGGNAYAPENGNELFDRMADRH